MGMIHIPDELFAKIASHAAQHGQSVDDIIASWLARDMQAEQAATLDEAAIEGYDPASDPLARFIGAFDLGEDPGWVERHDEYVGN